MSSRNERKALTTLSVMMLIGVGLLTIPLFLTPPAHLDLSFRDVAFGSDLSAQRVIVTDNKTGKTIAAAIQKSGNAFVARLGRINSGTSGYTARVTGYKPATAKVQAAALQTVRVPVDLTPTFGRLEITTLDAMHTNTPVEATLKDGGRAVTQRPERVVTLDLPPGRHRLSADAAGYCPSDREFDVQAGKLTKAVFPLSPDLQGDETARFVLGWRTDPRDLDTHFWKSPSEQFPSRTTVYFQNKVGMLPNGRTFARLDVDELWPGRYETLTVRRDAIGDYRYFIHVYQGAGTIADAVPTVQIYTRGCRVRTLTPPPDCAQRIWNVVNVRGDGDDVSITEVQRCEPEGTTAVIKMGI